MGDLPSTQGLVFGERGPGLITVMLAAASLARTRRAMVL